MKPTEELPRHWMSGGTGLTNFRKEEEPIFRLAIKLCGDDRIFIDERPMPAGNNDLSGYMSLHSTGGNEASYFWSIWRKVKEDFVAEAFTVAHETGMTPRQMAERIADLEAARVQLGKALAEPEIKGLRFKVYPDCEVSQRLMPTPPPGLPPLPQGTRYAGQLRDHEGDVRGYAFDFDTPEHGWVHCGSIPFGGRADWLGAGSAQWHVAVPI